MLKLTSCKPARCFSSCTPSSTKRVFRSVKVAAQRRDVDMSQQKSESCAFLLQALANSISQPQTSKQIQAPLAGAALPLIALGLLAAAEPSFAADAHHVNSPIYDLAEGQEFWGNVARYARYFVTVMLGTGYVMLRPLAGMFKNPISAILAIGGLVGGAYFMKFTLEAMLGMAEPFEYVEAGF